MAEAVALVGLIAACLQLSDGFLDLSNWIRATAKGMKYIPQHISELQANTDLFTICLRKLVRAVKKAYVNEPKSIEARETAKAMKIIKRQGRLLEAKISDLVDKAEGENSSTWLRVVAKLQVIFKPKGAQTLQDSLSRLMHTIDMLSSGVTLDFLLAKIKVLETSQQVVPEDLLEEVEMLKQEVVVHKNVAKDLEVRLALQIREANAGDEIMQDMENMLDESHQLDQIIKTTVSRYAPELVASSPKRTRKPKEKPTKPSNSSGDSRSPSRQRRPPRPKLSDPRSGATVVIEEEPELEIHEVTPPSQSRDKIVVIQEQHPYQIREVPLAQRPVPGVSPYYQMPEDLHRATDHTARRADDGKSQKEVTGRPDNATGDEIHGRGNDRPFVSNDEESVNEGLHEEWRSQADAPRTKDNKDAGFEVQNNPQAKSEDVKKFLIVENDAGRRYKVSDANVSRETRTWAKGHTAEMERKRGRPTKWVSEGRPSDQ